MNFSESFWRAAGRFFSGDSPSPTSLATRSRAFRWLTTQPVDQRTYEP